MRVRMRAIVMALTITCAALLIDGSVAAGPPTKSPDGTASMSTSLAGTVASKISYQGRLTDAVGNPLNGDYDLVFQLWDDPSAGSQVGDNISRSGVAVANGLFTVDLDVPQLEVNGQALWLRIQVNGQWLSPRQELLPVPYALSLRPGAQIAANSSETVLMAANQGTGTGLSAFSNQGWGLNVASSEDVAVFATSGTVPSILIQGKQAIFAYGEENGIIAWGGETGGTFEGSIGVKATGGHRGVDGRTESGEEGAAGVYGESINMQADGVRGQGAHGVHGVGYIGVFGEGDVGISGRGMVGVGGESEADTGAGVHGTATGLDGVGVRGTSDFGTGVEGTGETGVKGISSVGAGVKGEGSVGVEGVGQSAEGVAGTSQTTYGVTGEGVLGGVKGTSTGGDGVEGRSQSGSGVIGVSMHADGVVGNSQTGIGVYANSGGEAAVKGEGPKGVYGRSSADGGEGVHGHGFGSHTEGVLGTSANASGVYGISSGSTGGLSIGVRGQTSATWGLATEENLYVGGYCSGCTLAFVARNGDTSPLEVGDVVSVVGIAPPLKGQQAPVLRVRRGAVAGGSMLGVVQSRATVDTGERLVFQGDAAQVEQFEMPGGAAGPAAPGEYLFVVVQGLVQVRTHTSGGAIAAGDPVVPAATSGLAQKVSAAPPTVPVLGRALEQLAEGTGLIWVLILGG